jgi:hypothetical protein
MKAVGIAPMNIDATVMNDNMERNPIPDKPWPLGKEIKHIVLRNIPGKCLFRFE